jgi:hypothetical protein
MMRIIYRYCFSGLLIIWFILPSAAQEGRIKGIRIGYDLSRSTLQYLQPERKAFEISGDFEIKQNYYLTAEYGQQIVDMKNPGYDYVSDGYYARMGLDYNFSKNKKDVNAYEMVFGGLRYGYANYSHQATNIIFQSNYWGTETLNSLPEFNMNAHWFEVVAGVRGELFKNFFIGWSFRGRVMIWQKKDSAMYTYNIPGYGKGNKKSQVGFNYSVYYRIPLYKTKK